MVRHSTCWILLKIQWNFSPLTSSIATLSPLQHSSVITSCVCGKPSWSIDTVYCLSTVLTRISFFPSGLFLLFNMCKVYILCITLSSSKQYAHVLSHSLVQPCYSSLQFLFLRYLKYLPVMASPSRLLGDYIWHFVLRNLVFSLYLTLLFGYCQFFETSIYSCDGRRGLYIPLLKPLNEFL